VSTALPYSYFDFPAEIEIALFDRVIGAIDEMTGEII
jgi:hypothetical protein